MAKSILLALRRTPFDPPPIAVVRTEGEPAMYDESPMP